MTLQIAPTSVLLGPQGFGKAMGAGRLYHVERFEVGVELAPDTFALQPPTDSGLRK